MPPLYPRHFEIEGNFLVVYDDLNDFVVHTLRLSETFSMVTNLGGILYVTTKNVEKIVVANGLTMKQVKFYIEIIEEAIQGAKDADKTSN